MATNKTKNARIDASETGMALNAGEKVKITLLDREALEEGRTPTPHYVGINGYSYFIPWNKEVEVPVAVKEILQRQHLLPM